MIESFCIFAVIISKLYFALLAAYKNIVFIVIYRSF